MEIVFVMMHINDTKNLDNVGEFLPKEAKCKHI